MAGEPHKIYFAPLLSIQSIQKEQCDSQCKGKPYIPPYTGNHGYEIQRAFIDECAQAHGKYCSVPKGTFSNLELIHL